MSKNDLPKLVRDKIPVIMASCGVECDMDILSGEDYVNALEAKLDEEIAEYHADHTLEELADLVEVIYSLVEASGHRVGELHEIRWKKLNERGGFGKGTLLKKIYCEEKKDD